MSGDGSRMYCGPHSTYYAVENLNLMFMYHVPLLGLYAIEKAAANLCGGIDWQQRQTSIFRLTSHQDID